MIDQKAFITALARNVSILKMQTAGITHEESLLQPPFRGNCLNWVVGHIAVHRDLMLGYLGAPPVLGDAGARYGRESEPITGDGEDVLPLQQLLEALDQQQAALWEAVGGASAEVLDLPTPASNNRTVPMPDRLFFYYFHEVYHTGQTELLRQLAGKNDKVI